MTGASYSSIRMTTRAPWWRKSMWDSRTSDERTSASEALWLNMRSNVARSFSGTSPSST